MSSDDCQDEYEKLQKAQEAYDSARGKQASAYQDRDQKGFLVLGGATAMGGAVIVLGTASTGGAATAGAVAWVSATMGTWAAKFGLDTAETNAYNSDMDTGVALGHLSWARKKYCDCCNDHDTPPSDDDD